MKQSYFYGRLTFGVVIIAVFSQIHVLGRTAVINNRSAQYGQITRKSAKGIFTVSDDNGASWRRISLAPTQQQQHGHITRISAKGVIKISDDNGATWYSPETQILQKGHITRTSVGGWVTVSNDNGATWRVVSFPHYPTAHNSQGQTAFASLYPFVKAVENTRLSVSQDLQLSPDPFVQELKISYVLRIERQVSIVVYNALGKKVADIARGVQSIGIHSAVFRAGNLPDGVYYVRYTANGAQIVMPVLLAR